MICFKADRGCLAFVVLVKETLSWSGMAVEVLTDTNAVEEEAMHYRASQEAIQTVVEGWAA